jgi:hypothetical protein
VIVIGDEEAHWRKELLARHLGNNSRFRLFSEYVSFGSRPSQLGPPVDDSYWRLEGDYTYRILGFVYSIRIGAGVLRGNSFFIDETTGQPMPLPSGSVGFTYGFSEMRFRMGRLVRFDLKATLGAGPQHFDGGAGGQLIIGYDPGTHFALGVDGVSSIGVRVWTRLAWNTVPRMPMSFTIEGLNLPTNGDLSGRIYLAADLLLHRHMSLNAMVGYAARSWRIGGPVIGGGTTFEF